MPQSIAGQTQSQGGVLRLDRDKAQALLEKTQLTGAIEALAPLRDKLLTARKQRPQAARDEKIVTADNGLAILGFVQAGEALQDKALIRTATETADWEWRHAFDRQTGLLRHQYFHSHAGDAGFLDDYALLGQAFLALQRATGDAVWQTRARQLADAMLKRFAHPDGSLATTSDTSDLLVAPPAKGDSVQPSGQSSAVALLLALGTDNGDPRYAVAARRALAPLSARIAAQPSGWGSMLASLAQPALVAALNAAPQGQQTPIAGELPSSADHVHVQAHLAPAKTGAELSVSIAIDPGFHINANPATDPDLIPTQLVVDGSPDLHVDYPQAQVFKAPFAPQGIAVYTGQVQLRAHLPQLAPVKTRLRVQACNDTYCLAPDTVEVLVSRVSK